MTHRNYDLHEFFADEFAMALLMPVSDICPQINSGNATIATLARRYRVPRAAVIQWVGRLLNHPPEGHRLSRRKAKRILRTA